MRIIIDGYNLLNVVNVFGVGHQGHLGPGSLERSRLALLNFLAASLDPHVLAHTTVVFDAKNPPPGLPREMRHHGLKVLFAARDQDADTLIEELIRADSSPRSLTVVSSDHRIQRAAHRRRAKGVDSDVWHASLLRERRKRQETSSQGPERPDAPLLDEDVDYWVRQFGGDSPPTELDAKTSGLEAMPPIPPAHDKEYYDKGYNENDYYDKDAEED